MEPLKRWVIKNIKTGKYYKHGDCLTCSTTIDEAEVFSSSFGLTSRRDEKIVRYESELCFGW